MKRKVLAAVAGGVIASVAIPAAASAAPPESGANVVLQQNGVTTTRLCAYQDVWFAASGFAPNRGRVLARIEVIGGTHNPIFEDSIPLTDGAGTWDTGTPGPNYIGDKVRVRYQTGSTSHPVNRGSFSAMIVNC